MTMLWRSKTESNYSIIRPLRLETVSYRWFVDPYGPHHEGAMGRMFSWVNLPYDMESRTHETYIDRIEPPMQEGEYCPVEFVRRTKEFIEVKIDFKHSRLLDLHGIDGQVFKLYPWTEPHRR